MNKKVVKEFIKENFIWVALLFFVVFGLGGAKVYNAIHSKHLEVAYNNYEKEDLEVYYEQQKYEANEYRVISKSKQDLAEYYYKIIKKMWLEDPGKIYDLMTKKAQKTYESREKFTKRMNNYITSQTPKSFVEYYSVQGGEIVILTNESIQIELIQDGINKYQIKTMEKVD